MSELLHERELTVLVGDAVVGIGLTVLVLGQTVLYFATILLILDFGFSGLGFQTFVFATLFLGPIAIVFWINMGVVRSSNKAVVVCFLQVIEIGYIQ